MRTLSCFIATTLDGFSAGPSGEIDWHNVDDEFNRFSISQIRDVDTLVFGRKTYEGMVSYWPTAAARQDDPTVAELMNTMPKVVFSTTLERAGWENTTLVKGNLAAEMTKLKEQPGRGLISFGSAELTASLVELGLVDELRVIVNPVTLGQGKSLFHRMTGRVHLELLQTRVFTGSGNVLLTYRPLRGDRTAADASAA